MKKKYEGDSILYLFSAITQWPDVKYIGYMYIYSCRCVVLKRKTRKNKVKGEIRGTLAKECAAMQLFSSLE